MIHIPVNLTLPGALRLVATAYLRGQSVDGEDADRLAAETNLVQCLPDARLNALHGLIILSPLADTCTLEARVSAASMLRSLAGDIERAS